MIWWITTHRNVIFRPHYVAMHVPLYCIYYCTPTWDIWKWHLLRSLSADSFCDMILFVQVSSESVGDMYSYAATMSIAFTLCVCLSVSPPHIPIFIFNHSNKMMPSLSYVRWFHCNRSDERLVEQKLGEWEREMESHDAWVPHYLVSKYYSIYTHIKKSQERVLAQQEYVMI